ncbi:Flp family type IVb pilin [Pendulispora rubella]|uniref:Flp family type IVb pilin n=1 Tax=Pendulispora rubella TaxID=2741070 RepID=A0ABZ2KXK3_9BACT
MTKDIMKLVKDEKGAAAVEYALILVSVILVVSGTYRKLGKIINRAVNDALAEF